MSRELTTTPRTRPSVPPGLRLGERLRQLRVAAGFLANGVSTDERGRLDAALSRAEAMLEAFENQEAHDEFERLLPGVRSTGVPELELRAVTGHAKAKMRLGDHRAALEQLGRARELVESGSFSDVERAEVYFVLAVCRFQLSSVQTALALFNQALELAERSGLPCDALRSKILSERSRAWRSQRDY